MIRAAVTAVALGFAVAVPALAAEPPIDGIGDQVRLAPDGPTGEPLRTAADPDIAYNARHDEFYVVWSDRDARSDRTNVYGRRLDGQGNPVGAVALLTRASWATGHATDPAIAYDPDRDRYLVAYERETGWSYGVSIEYRLLDGASGAAREATDAIADLAESHRQTDRRNPDVIYDASRRRFVVIWDEVVYPSPVSPPAASWIVGWEIDPESGRALSLAPVTLSDSCLSADCQAFAPVAAADAASGSYLVAWVQSKVADTPGALWGRPLRGLDTTAGATGSRPVRFTEGLAMSAALAVHGGRALLAHTQVSGSRPPSVHASLLAVGTGDVAVVVPPRPVNVGAHGVGAERPAVAFHPGRDAFLVAWNGTEDGMNQAGAGEREATAQVIDRDGLQVGLDDFPVSEMGFAGADDAGTGPHPPAVVANARTGQWLVAWAAEDNRPPLSQGEFEMWGRRVGPNDDRDGDGVAAPADCDDLNVTVHPGARDLAGNGIDEDCSGVDNQDGDGDGVAAPRDCDDDDPAIRPGRRDVAGNGVDEDCDGRDRAPRTGARVGAAWLFAARSTRVARISITGIKPGMTVIVRCRGVGCPVRLRGRGHSVRARRTRSLSLTPLLRAARLAPGTVVEIRVEDRVAIGVLERFAIRAGAPPRQTTRCLVPGRRAPVRCGG